MSGVRWLAMKRCRFLCVRVDHGESITSAGQHKQVIEII